MDGFFFHPDGQAIPQSVIVSLANKIGLHTDLHGLYLTVYFEPLDLAMVALVSPDQARASADQESYYGVMGVIFSLTDGQLLNPAVLEVMHDVLVLAGKGHGLTIKIEFLPLSAAHIAMLRHLL